MSDYETVWHGGLHKSIPPPPQPVESLKVRYANRPAVERKVQVLAAVNEQPQTIAQIARAAGLSLESTTRYLAGLWATGQIERIKEPYRQRTGCSVRYRRVA